MKQVWHLDSCRPGLNANSATDYHCDLGPLNLSKHVLQYTGNSIYLINCGRIKMVYLKNLKNACHFLLGVQEGTVPPHLLNGINMLISRP